jgi:hypothetical protein
MSTVYPIFETDNPRQNLRNRASRLSKESLITSLTPASPALPPHQHRSSHKHRQKYPNTKEGKRPAVIRRVDEMLNGEGNGEVDAGGTDGEDDDEFSGDLARGCQMMLVSLRGKEVCLGS